MDRQDLSRQLSREVMEKHHYDKHPWAEKFEVGDDKWSYRLEVIVRRDGRSGTAAFRSMKIESTSETDGPSSCIRSGKKDQRHCGELMFLLAAKLKYDLLDGCGYDNAGFVHCDQIRKLRDRHRTAVPAMAYACLRALCSGAKNPNDLRTEGYRSFLRGFLSHPDQLWHLVFCCGARGAKAENQNLVWWLNVSPENLSFFWEGSTDPIPDGDLKDVLAKLFPESSLVGKRVWSGFLRVLDRLPVAASVADENGEDIGIRTASTEMLQEYGSRLITEMYKNLVIELVREDHFEDICITPLIRPLRNPYGSKTVYDMSSLVSASRSAIVGEPGSGKTHALRKLALALVRQDPITVVPVYVSLASFAAGVRQNAEHDLEKHIDRQLEAYGCTSLRSLSKIPGIMILLLLDDWDEVQNEEYLRYIRPFFGRTPHHCIAATRPDALHSLPIQDCYVMEPLSLERMREFLRLRVKKEDDAEALWRWLRDTPSVQKLGKNPLSLSVISIVFEEQEQWTQSFTKTQLFARAFDVIWRQYYKENPHTGFQVNGRDITAEVLLILRRLAYDGLASGGTRFFHMDQFHKVAAEVLGFVPAGLYPDLTGRLSVIRDCRSGYLEFFHRWYRDFLAAQHIAEPGETVDSMVDMLDQSHVCECLSYVVGLVPQHKALAIMMEAPIHDLSGYCGAIAEGHFSKGVVRDLLLRAVRWAEESQRIIPVRLELSRALAEAGTIALESLYSIVRDSRENSDYVRRGALEALALLEDDDERFSRLVLELLSDTSCGVLWHAMEHAGSLGIIGAEELLHRHASAEDPITAGTAIWALGRIGIQPDTGITSEMVRGLCDCLLCDDEHVQGHALRTLGGLKLRQAIPALREHVQRPEARYRWLVPSAASLIGGEDAVNLLQECLHEEDRRVVVSAIQGIGEVRDPIPDGIVRQIECHVGDGTMLSFSGQTVGSAARSTLAKLSRKGVRGRLAQIYICRHGKTAWNQAGRLQGKRDIPLCAAGIRELRDNIRAVEQIGIDRICCSNTKRARQTAEIYAEHLGVPVHVSPRLREMDHESWEEEYIDRLLEDNSSGYAEWLRNPSRFGIPGSHESITSAQQRILEEVRDIALWFRNESVLVVSHKHILAALVCAIEAIPLTSFASVIEESIEPRLLSPASVARICKEQTEP